MKKNLELLKKLMDEKIFNYKDFFNLEVTEHCIYMYAYKNNVLFKYLESHPLFDYGHIEIISRQNEDNILRFLFRDKIFRIHFSDIEKVKFT